MTKRTAPTRKTNPADLKNPWPEWRETMRRNWQRPVTMIAPPALPQPFSFAALFKK